MQLFIFMTYENVLSFDSYMNELHFSWVQFSSFYLLQDLPMSLMICYDSNYIYEQSHICADAFFEIKYHLWKWINVRKPFLANLIVNLRTHCNAVIFFSTKNWLKKKKKLSRDTELLYVFEQIITLLALFSKIGRNASPSHFICNLMYLNFDYSIQMLKIAVNFSIHSFTSKYVFLCLRIMNHLSTPSLSKRKHRKQFEFSSKFRFFSLPKPNKFLLVINFRGKSCSCFIHIFWIINFKWTR